MLHEKHLARLKLPVWGSSLGHLTEWQNRFDHPSNDWAFRQRDLQVFCLKWIESFESHHLLTVFFGIDLGPQRPSYQLSSIDHYPPWQLALENRPNPKRKAGSSSNHAENKDSTFRAKDFRWFKTSWIWYIIIWSFPPHKKCLPCWHVDCFSQEGHEMNSLNFNLPIKWYM